MKTALCLIFFLTSFSLFGQKSELVNNEWISGVCKHLIFNEDSCQVLGNGEKYRYDVTDSTLILFQKGKCNHYKYEIQDDSIFFSGWPNRSSNWREYPPCPPIDAHLSQLKRKTNDSLKTNPFDTLNIQSRKLELFALNDEREFTFKLSDPVVWNPDYSLPGFYSGKFSDEEWKELKQVLYTNCVDDSSKSYIYQKIPTYTSYPSDKTGARDTIPRVLVNRNGHFESDYVKGKVQKSFYDSESKKYYYSFRPIEGYVTSLQPSENHTGKGRLMLLYSLVRIPEDSLVEIILKHTDEGEINFQKTRKRGLNIRYLRVDGVYPIKTHKVIFKGRWIPSSRHPLRLNWPPNKKLFANWRWRMTDLAKFLKEISKDYIRMREAKD